MLVEITLKSGAKVVAEVESWETNGNPLRSQASWSNDPDASTSLQYLDWESVAAVVVKSS